MSKPHRDLELTGRVDLEAVLRQVFTALSGGVVLPTDPTSTESQAYFGETTRYLTAQGDGLTVFHCLDYGEWHMAWFPSLVVGDISIENVGHPRGPDVVLRISAPEDRIDEAAATVERIVTAKQS